MHTNNKNIVITGFMGVGKSTVGKVVARQLNREFIDTDEVIEKRYKKSISDFFLEGNEHLFRAAEYELCSELSQNNNLVIATGGGTLVPYKSYKLFAESSQIVLLKTSFDIILKRIKNSSRPLVSLSSNEELLDLFNQRESAYNRIINQVEVKGESVEEIAEKVIQKIFLSYCFDSIKILSNIPHQKPYPIYLKKGLITEIQHLSLSIGLKPDHIHVITDDNVWRLYEQFFKEHIRCQKLSVSIIPHSEENKNLTIIQKIYEDLSTNHACKETIILSLGGGVVLDAGGFVAATYMRGAMKLINIPTTLLAMVDASIGGKTAVNIPAGKNLVGAFKHPCLVAVDTGFLDTLHEDEYCAAYAEIIKHAIIDDKELFDAMIYQSLSIESLIQRSITIKKKYVELDPYDAGIRNKLNFGHTFGHAIECASGFTLKHGYAVALGMVIAAEMGLMLKTCSEEVVNSIKNILQKYHLPIQNNNLDVARIVEGLWSDKKRTSKSLVFLVPKLIGTIEQVTDVSNELIEQSIRKVIRVDLI